MPVAKLQNLVFHPSVGVRGMRSAEVNFLTGSREFRSYAKWCQCTFTIFTCVRFLAKASQNDRFTISTLEKQINCDYWTWFISAWHIINGAYVSTTRHHSMLKMKPIYIVSLWLKNFAARYSTATRSLPPYIEFCFKFLLNSSRRRSERDCNFSAIFPRPFICSHGHRWGSGSKTMVIHPNEPEWDRMRYVVVF